jgi:hypothetical protein
VWRYQPQTPFFLKSITKQKFHLLEGFGIILGKTLIAKNFNWQKKKALA